MGLQALRLGAILLPMPQFIDLQGASGAQYRFRLASGFSPLAGNFVFVRTEQGRALVVGAGTATSLKEVAALWRRAVDELQAEAVYLYLNIASRARLPVHDDIVQQHNPPFVALELGAS